MEDLRIAANSFPLQWASIIRFLLLGCSVAIMSLVVLNCSTNDKQRAPLEELKMKAVTVNGLRISYIEEGVGKPMVLVHGIPTSSFLWRKMIKPLSARAKVYALDLPGFGFSDPPPNANYSVSEYARIFGAFLDTLSIQDATLVCHDLGGPIVLTYALRNPEKYQKLIILDTFLHSDFPMPLSLKIAKIRPMGEIFFWLAGRSIIRKAITDGVVDTSQISEEVVDQYYIPEGSPDKIKEAMLGTLRVDYSDDLKFIETNLSAIVKPTMIIWGEKDSYLPISLGERIHRDIPGSRMERLSDCSHFFQEDCPEQVTELILDFIKMEARQ
jgi:pimeloyl-ACP methyl ester carboxylesterase